MGRIRTSDIKNAGNRMLAQESSKFSTEFDSNKLVVNQHGFKLSKRVRNRLAGYITRHKRIEARG